MNKLLAGLLLAGTFGCTQSKNMTGKNNDGWEPLFDGKTTAGWHTFNKTTIGSAWQVEDGTLHLAAGTKDNWQTRDGGDIISEAEFDNFHLKLDWKVAKNGNSGVIFYAQEEPQYEWAWKTGLEMQILHNEGHADGKIIKHRAGDLYDIIASSPETVKGPGEWNHAEIVSNNGLLQFYLNGTKVVETTLWNDAWRAMVAGSKFKDMPGWGTFKKGKISLQDHGDDVWFRNIMIKRL